MAKKVYVYDPTTQDSLSRVRGIGRYLQLLKENFNTDFEFMNFEKVINMGDGTFVNPFFNFLSPPLILRRQAKKQVAVIHDLIPLKYGSYFPAGLRGNMNIFLNKLAIKNYDAIITDSEASKKDIVNILGINEKIINVVYPCLTKSLINSRKTEGETEIELPQKFCVYVGDATWNKNLVNLARAIKIVNATCVFVGKIFKEPVGNHPWQRELRSFMEEVKGDRRFIFPGFISDYSLFKIYQQAALNVLPSRDEGFGFSWLEAASNSCPSLVSNIPVLREISDGKALFAEPENPADIAERIGEIYFRRDVRNKIGRMAFKRSLFFNPEKFRSDFLEVV